MPASVISAIRTLYLEKWVYLRDLNAYSIFLHPDRVVGFGVVGLTQPIREITQGPGWIFETGVMAFEGKFICDGLLGDPIRLGSEVRKEFDQAFQELKALGAFHVVPKGGWTKSGPTESHQPIPALSKAKAPSRGSIRIKARAAGKTQAPGKADSAPARTVAKVEGSKIPFTPLQGQYLAFIQAYSTIHGEPPAEREIQIFFKVTPPVVHQMILALASKGYLHREPGKARSLRVLLPPESLPVLVRPSSYATQN